MSRYLADENIPAPTIQALRAAGFDVVAIAEAAGGSSDDNVLTIARDQGRILLTFDLDMGELTSSAAFLLPPVCCSSGIFPAGCATRPRLSSDSCSARTSPSTTISRSSPENASASGLYQPRANG